MATQVKRAEHGSKSGYRNGCRCELCYATYRDSRKNQGAFVLTHPDDRRHGTLTGYQYGCRCEQCKAAKRKKNEYAAAQMAADPGDKRHGTYTGYTYGCRCDRCKRARDAYNEARRPEPVTTGPLTDEGMRGALK